MKERLFLSLLSIVALVYFSLPRLPLHNGNEATAFTIVWLGFCVLAFGGNLSGLLYRTNKSNARSKVEPRKSTERERKRGTSI
ncbi:MAG TPA: hypothetical protein VFK37_05390 [Bacillales bacterium]|nr:hypothetical protein [Bacillales bacterium]